MRLGLTVRAMLLTTAILAGGVLWLGWGQTVRGACDPRYAPACVAIDEPRW